MIDYERITLPDVSDDDNATLNLNLKTLKDKQQRNLLRASYYDGKRAIRQIGSVIPPQYYRLGLVLGWSAKAVDILARRCNLDKFVWPDGDLNSLGYREVWERNDLGIELSGALKSSLKFGPAFIINTRGDESAGEPAALIHVKDARSASGRWNPRTRRLDDLVSVLEWDDDGRPKELVYYLDGYTIEAVKDEGSWSVNVTEHPWGVPAEPVVYKPEPGRPFGYSRISRPVMSLHDQALREIIRLEGHMDIYSYPELWMLGADEKIFKNADGSQKAAWQVMLGRIKGIPDDDNAEQPRADVKQFPASTPQPHLAALNAFAKMFARETSLPDTALAITDISNPTSAESYDASQYELIAEAEGATDDWTPPLRRAMTRALAMSNGMSEIPESWETIDGKWRNPRYQSRAAEADAGMKQLSAIPWLAESEVGLELLGLSEQQIRRAMADRRRSEGSGVLATLQAAAGQVASPADDAAAIKAKADAMGALIRSGVSTESAAATVGLSGMVFTGAVPVSLRLPESDASNLEQD